MQDRVVGENELTRDGRDTAPSRFVSRPPTNPSCHQLPSHLLDASSSLPATRYFVGQTDCSQRRFPSHPGHGGMAAIAVSSLNRMFFCRLGTDIADDKNNRRLVPELIDAIINHLHDDIESLRACSLVCKAWTRSARCHLFSELIVDGIGLIVERLLESAPICHPVRPSPAFPTTAGMGSDTTTLGRVRKHPVASCDQFTCPLLGCSGSVSSLL